MVNDTLPSVNLTLLHSLQFIINSSSTCLKHFTTYKLSFKFSISSLIQQYDPFVVLLFNKIIFSLPILHFYNRKIIFIVFFVYICLYLIALFCDFYFLFFMFFFYIISIST